MQSKLTSTRRELERADTDYEPSRIADRKLDELVLGSAFAARFPATHDHLTRIAGEFTRSDAAWQNIGNSCRQALLEFCTECYDSLDIAIPEETKRGDLKALTRHLVNQLYGKGRSADALQTLIASVWDYAQPLTHRPAATREEAMRLYLWTGLAIDEVARMINGGLNDSPNDADC
jgi:hypothetical protein